MDYELICIGIGPSNLALAVAMEDSAPKLAGQTLMLEREPDVAWQRGMLHPGSRSQVSYLKDLVTLRNPRSRFTFVNYLHENGKLEHFVNSGTFTPYRFEISDYHAWVAHSLEHIELRFNANVRNIDAIGAPQSIEGWMVALDSGETITARKLVFGCGRDARIPEALSHLDSPRIIHSSTYRSRMDELLKTIPDPRQVAVIGSAQSAAELFLDAGRRLPNAKRTMIMRTIGPKHYESSKFTNELFYTEFVDDYYAFDPLTRKSVLEQMGSSNYGGLAPATLEQLYEERYLARARGLDTVRFRTLTTVMAATLESDGIALAMSSPTTGESTERFDVVLLGTGYDPQRPLLLRRLLTQIGQENAAVHRNYTVNLGPGGHAASLVLQGINEATHGIADSLLSVLASRAGTISDALIKTATMVSA